MLRHILEQTRRVRPLVHCITNYVTANDCANLLLACGASPIMADDPQEAAEVTALCDALVLNMGTPNPRRLEAMRLAGRQANALGRPVVLDPVGVGSSQMRREAAGALLESVRFAIIRCNASELAVLARGGEAHRGVDADTDMQARFSETIALARGLARESGAALLVTGDTDIVTDGENVWRVHNGHPMMRAVTGTGCQLSALAGAFAAANSDQPARAALAAACAMGLCGEIAYGCLAAQEGSATYRNRIIDAMYRLTPQALERGAKYED